MRCVDLFSGCGGMSLGFSRAGIDVVLAIDNWDKAVNVYKKNFSHDCYLHDLKDELSTLEIISKYDTDIIIGGPPCQDFSSAGKRNENLGRADLTYTFSNIICKYKPKYFVMENVERIKSSKVLADVIKQFISGGYGLTGLILDASYCNVPQARKRFFLIGILNEKHNVMASIVKKNISEEPMTIRDYLGNKLGVEYYYRHPRNYSRRGLFSIDEPSPTVRGVNRPVPLGYKKHQSDPLDATLANMRPLTTIERSYIQTFPENFEFYGTKTDLEQMIGNAVPVNMAELIAKSIMEYAHSNCKHTNKLDRNLFGNSEFSIPVKPLHLNITTQSEEGADSTL